MIPAKGNAPLKLRSNSYAQLLVLDQLCGFQGHILLAFPPPFLLNNNTPKNYLLLCRRLDPVLRRFLDER